MARAAVLGRLNWRLGEVVELIDETRRARTIVLDVPEWQRHRPGQHVDVRLTAEDGYQAQRSFSIASAPEEERLMLTAELLDDGEVSSYLVEELRAGDVLELRGPIGGYFVWDVSVDGPLLLIAGGSGIVPLMAMLRHRSAAGSRDPARLIYSSRSWDNVIFRDELEQLAARDAGLSVIHTLTRTQPPDWRGYARRVDAQMLEEAAIPSSLMPNAYICGPTSFVETASRALVLLGHQPKKIKTERFGPTGG
jgi:ferredoxin-NADP reductase